MRLVDSTIEDALSYVDLVILWPKYVRAIETLDAVGAHWLFVDAGTAGSSVPSRIPAYVARCVSPVRFPDG